MQCPRGTKACTGPHQKASGGCQQFHNYTVLGSRQREACNLVIIEQEEAHKQEEGNADDEGNNEEIEGEPMKQDQPVRTRRSWTREEGESSSSSQGPIIARLDEMMTYMQGM